MAALVGVRQDGDGPVARKEACQGARDRREVVARRLVHVAERDEAVGADAGLRDRGGEFAALAAA